MADLDSLSIQIKASTTDATRKIDELIASLGRLNAALNNYAEGSDYIKGMNNLSLGLKGISNAINSIDLQKINSVKGALSSLAGAGEKITKLNFVSTFSQLGSETQKINSAAANTTKYLMEMFNVPRSYKSDLTDAVKMLYQSANNPTAFTQASKDITNLVRKAQYAKKNLSETYTAVRQYLNNSKMYIPSDVIEHWGDDAKSKRATIGLKNTTTDYSQDATTLEVMARELKEVYGASIDVDHGLEAMADSLVDFLNDEKNISLVHANLERLGDILDELREKIIGTKESFNEMAHMPRVDEEGFMVADFTGDFFDFEEDATKASVAVNNLTSSVDALKSQTSVEIENPFTGLINGLESLNNISIPAEKFAGLATLASSLGKFGGKNASNAIINIPQFGRAFASMAAELSKAPAISSNLVKMAEALSNFSKNAYKASASTNQFKKSTSLLGSALSNLNFHTLRSHKSFLGLAAIFGHLYANFFLLIRGARLLGKAMEYSSSMTEAANVVSVVFGKSSDVMDEFAKTSIKDFGLARLSAVEFASRFQAMGKTMGISSEQIVKANDFIYSKISGNTRAYKDLGDSVADMSINLTKLTADIASLYNQDYEDVAKDMQSIYTGMTRPLRKYGLDLTNATLKEFALSQGLDSNIEKMTQAEKTMLRYQYVMSRAAGAMGDFQKTQDTWANSLRTVKQLLQEVARMVGEALINALRPALLAFKQFLFNFLDLTEKALNAIGKLLGWHQIDFGGASLVEDTEDYADALDDAAGAAKKLKNQLRGIDELNNLTTNQGSGSGAGTSAGLGANIESIWDQIIDTDRVYESNVKNWKDFGQRIANSIKDGLSNVNWEEIYNESSAFGTNLASFLNGLIDPSLWNLFGKTIAGGVMTAIKFAFSFGEEFDFKNLGESIAEGINGFFEEFEGGKLADTLNVWADGLEKTFKSAAKKIKWDEVFYDLFDFFKHLDIKTIGIIVGAGTVITGMPALTMLLGKELIKNPLTLGAITIASIGGFKLGEYISTQWEEALGTNPETGESYWQEYWEKIFKSYEDTFNWYVENEGRSLIWTAISKFFTKDGLKVIAQSNKDVFDKTLGGEWNPFRKMWDNILTDPLNEWFDEHGIETQSDLKEYGKLLWKNLWGIEDKDKNEGPKKWFELFFEELGKSENTATGQDYFDFYLGWIFKLDWSSIIDDLNKFNAALTPILSSLVAFGDPANVTGIENVGTSFIGVNENIGLAGNALGTLLANFDTFKEKTAKLLQEWWDKDVAPKFDLPKWTGLVSTIKESIVKVWEDLVKWWDEKVPLWLENDVKSKFNFNTWSAYLSPIKDAFEQTWSDALSFAKNFWKTIADYIEKVINGTIDGFGKIVAAKDLLTGSVSNFNVTHIDIPTFGKGGFPKLGSLFIANEAGPELIGTMNGKTAVSSNNEITGITQAIRSASDAELQLLRRQNELLIALVNKEFGISKNELFSSVRSSAREYTKMTGNSAFL